MKWLRMFQASPVEEAGRRLYVEAVAQARHPDFYERLGVPDTPDGRFDMVVLHVVLVMRRLRRDHRVAGATSQALFDIMFADMDQNLREMGVGDIGVSTRIKAMAQGFYGRLAAYDSALNREQGADLWAALERNLYRKCRPSESHVAAMVAYIRDQADRLDACPIEAVLGGDVGFPPPFEETRP